MTDIFFSYSSKDRERVRRVYDALTDQGFDIFWDQELPAGIKWDAWIRQHLSQAKCAIVFWSAHSAGSDNVHHEATIAKQHGKLIPVMLDVLSAEQFPMGLYAVQGVNLSDWAGDAADREWQKLSREVEAKLTPMWMRRMIDGLEAELVSERARRESAERRDKTLRDQIAKEANSRQDLQRELEHAREEIDTLKAQLQAATAPRPVIQDSPAAAPREARGTPAPAVTASQPQPRREAERAPAPTMAAPAAQPERLSHVAGLLGIQEPKARGWFGLSAMTLFAIAGGLVILMLALLPAGLSLIGALLLVTPAGVLCAHAVSITRKNHDATGN